MVATFMTSSTMRFDAPWLSRWHWTLWSVIWARRINLLPGPCETGSDVVGTHFIGERGNLPK